MSELKALIFDVDGTLADTEKDAHLVAFNQTFTEFGLDWHWSTELYGELLAVTGGKERMKFYLERYRPDFQKPDNLDDFITQLHKKKTILYNDLIEQGKIPLRTGIKRLLQEARQAGFRLAIATTTTLENVTTLLKSSLAPDSVEWFEVIGAGAVVPAKKPAPDIYHYVLEKLNLSPEHCLAFEDSENGIRSAKGAGLRTIITVNDYTHDQEFTGAELVLNHLGEPDLPCTVLAGDIGDASYVNVAVLKKLFSVTY